MLARRSRTGLPLLAAGFAACFIFLSGAQAVSAEVPFGDEGGVAVTNYDRVAPGVATGGLLKEGGVDRLKALGFKVIVDLRGPEEGIEAEKAAAQGVGIRYFNIPVTSQLPTPAQVEAFAGIMDDPEASPVLVHCQSANRVGAMWALYRAKKGVPGAVAIEEGRAIGLQIAREKALRSALSD